MVKLVEIEDDGVYDSDSQYTTDDDHSSASTETDKEDNEDSDSDFDDSDDDTLDESFLERISALKDIVPIEKRRAFSSAVSNIQYWGNFGLHLAGKLGWVFSTSALLVVFPLAIASDRDKMMQQWEGEQNSMAASGGQQLPVMGGMPPQPGMPGTAASSAPGIVA
ncbi:mitochondrial import receptor subunit Tom22 [Coemansia thaxteri]|uniref:Mitochondrial import receptor subunit Tom22 n=1 Tax=Coemansia thaxteri TaxID=2663907 RepID=A0A9W8BL12_9FUNG|nr:mitochondrial import receptor subunit Tom22 [Coemansia thaxteri]KAJ2004876.1 mitochondrial import receptor subunit Tom22 [Coemansia thaxteri]KAJ2471881.1 mitochondrial import receptor subunit Tom22 [Coemansia sp. RSA 2322]KAJ2485125.1 mitochondrial import receptor subunit Tom22 [Coemansia sp. RSA 2320]